MTQTKTGTCFQFYLSLMVVECIVTAQSITSTISEGLPATLLHGLLQPYSLDCHVVLQGIFEKETLESLHSQRPLLLLETTNRLDLDSGIWLHKHLNTLLSHAVAFFQLKTLTGISS